MRARTVATLLLLLLTAIFAIASEKPTPAAAVFEKMKTLAGNWEVTWQGKPDTMSLQVISAGSAIMQSDNKESMVTMYHLDGERLMMTHYCAAKNQPRMVAEVSPDGKTISFNFLDVTNLAGPDAGHMRHMVLTFEDANHFTEQWTFRKDGKDGSETFRYARKQ
jgi:hypothetical protein